MLMKAKISSDFLCEDKKSYQNISLKSNILLIFKDVFLQN